MPDPQTEPTLDPGLALESPSRGAADAAIDADTRPVPIPATQSAGAQRAGKNKLRLKIAPQLQGFSSHMGPFYELRLPNGSMRRGLELDMRHINPEGVIHGGVLSAFADYVLYRCIGDELGHDTRFATIQLNLQFLASSKPGRWLYGEGLVLRKTRDLIFASGELFTEERSLASASGIWKVLSQA